MRLRLYYKDGKLQDAEEHQESGQGGRFFSKEQFKATFNKGPTFSRRLSEDAARETLIKQGYKPEGKPEPLTDKVKIQLFRNA